MEEISRRLYKAMVLRGLKQADLVERTGIGKSSISTYLTGAYDPKQRNLYKLAEVLDVAVEWLMGYDVPMGHFSPGKPNNTAKETAKDAEALPKNVLAIRKRRVPLLGSIAAGKPIFAPEDHESYVDVDDSVKCNFALRVQGDSMIPRFLDGDIVFVREQPNVLDGQFAAVFADDEAVLKRVYHDRDGVTLVSENLDYKPIKYREDDAVNVRIVGLVVALYRVVHNGWDE